MKPSALLAAVAAALCLSGCQPKPEPAVTTPASSLRPAAGQSQVAVLYGRECAACHGPAGEGMPGNLGTALRGPDAEPLGSLDFLRALRNGEGPGRTLSAQMPRFGEGQLTDIDIEALRLYLKGL
ncbi:c-type cytochrome [Deinococcus lacus]|uniref:C-type cytochrome n=1 Tax=Deinococcus lacus TaxID=392561 RepID=A0ABW1YB52_9DEIO